MTAWTEVLNHIEHSLQQSLALVRSPARTPTGATVQEPAALRRLEGRLQQWEATLQESDRQAAGADVLLTGEQAALVSCREQLGRLRDWVANWNGKHGGGR